ncbi:MAG: FliI/YscN family ATPase [Phycisphaerae bacterium]
MDLFDPYRKALHTVCAPGIIGRVSSVRGSTVSVRDFPIPMGAACRIVRASGEIDARVVGFADESALVMPMGTLAGIARGDRVVFTSAAQTVAVGSGMLGRVLDAFGRPMDGGREVRAERNMPIWPEPIGPMRRRRITEPLGTGVRAIDAMLTVGRGQRMGIFSGAGVGKTVLAGMISRYTAADVTVIALIGERGREVKDYVEKVIGADGLKRSVVVASTSDQPPLARVHGGAVATAIAEFFRDRGCDVLLLMDSLTRLAAAQRLIGLSAGEPPATKGYTPSVFTLLPQLLERSGRTEEGSITGFYTVLVEGDDLSEPVSDAVRAVTDGHVYLSRELANRGQYPAIDVLRSVSRVMVDVADQEHRAAAREVHRLIALYSEIEDLVNIGAYQGGANAEYDAAIKAMPLIRGFLAQSIAEPSSLDQTLASLKDLQRQIMLFRHRPLARAASAHPSIRPAVARWVKDR